MAKSSSEIGFESNRERDLEHYEAVSRGYTYFTAHWQVFIPSLIIATLYGLICAGLIWTGKADFAFARFFIVTMAVLVPLLFAWAFLRHQTIRLELGSDMVRCHNGWPQDESEVMPLDQVTDVQVEFDLISRWFGGGDLIIIGSEKTVTVRGLSTPETAAKVIREAI